MDFAGYKEGEVIQHPMITKSIERAQKKVEENNFGIRKRLLEYDDVMNKQRTVIYSKRNHALFGERLALDLDNAFYSVAENVIFTYKDGNDYEGFKLATIIHFAVETSITQQDLSRKTVQDLAEQLYQEAIGNYTRKKEDIATHAVPVFKTVRKEQGPQIENIIVPFTDGKRGLQILANLDKTVETEGFELLNCLEKTATLNFIDDEWKEHLRAMDDLKQSVQTATYEQKDPLVIYKMEAFNLFKNMDSVVNKNIVEFLSHALIPVDNEAQVREGHQEKTDLSKLRTKKQEVDSAGRELPPEEEEIVEAPPVKQQPIIVGPKTGRNEPCPCGSGKKYKACHGRE